MLANYQIQVQTYVDYIVAIISALVEFFENKKRHITSLHKLTLIAFMILIST